MWGINGKKTTALAEDREKRRTKRVERDEKCQAKKDVEWINQNFK